MVCFRGHRRSSPLPTYTVEMLNCFPANECAILHHRCRHMQPSYHQPNHPYITPTSTTKLCLIIIIMPPNCWYCCCCRYSGSMAFSEMRHPRLSQRVKRLNIYVAVNSVQKPGQHVAHSYNKTHHQQRLKSSCSPPLQPPHR